MDAQLSVSITLTPNDTLILRTRIHNPLEVQIYILDRLWKLTAASNIAVDEEEIYRFERNRNLRLLLGAAPLPRLRATTYRNVPHATPVSPRSTYEREIAIRSPMREYSPYFPHTNQSTYESVKASEVTLLVQYIPGTDEVSTKPSPIYPDGVQIVSPVKALSVAREQSFLVALPSDINILRRTDGFDRLALPGEAPEVFTMPP